MSKVGECAGINCEPPSLMAWRPVRVAGCIGDSDGECGGLGLKGMQKPPEAVDGKLLPVDGVYQFKTGKFFNLSADNFIKDHADICNKEIAYAIVTAIAGV